MKKRCSGCTYWLKIHTIRGICEYDDSGWCPSDNHCSHWKAIAYSRKKKYPVDLKTEEE